MAYALFTARKLMLRNRLNQLNYRVMMLSQQQQNLAQESGNIEMMSGLKSSMNSIFVYDNCAKKQKDWLDQMKNGTLTESDYNNQMKSLEFETQKKTSENQAAALIDTARLKSIQVLGNQIELEMKKLETSVKDTAAEMESVEKEEDIAIKASAPKYGGGPGG